MATHIAWTADVPGVGEIEEHDPGDYEGHHRHPLPVFGDPAAYFSRWFIGMVIYNPLHREFDRVTHVSDTRAVSEGLR